MAARISGLGLAEPVAVCTNAELAERVDTSDEWIFSRTGISERRIAGPDESTFTLALAAGRVALADAGMRPEDLDLVIVATISPDIGFPAVANLVQDALGAKDAGAFDINTACTGFVYGLSLANALIESGQANNALVIGAETMSRIVDWTDRSTCVLFGDGAGAAVLTGDGYDQSFLSFELGSDGGGAASLYRSNAFGVSPFVGKNDAKGSQLLQMDGREVYKFAIGAIVKTIRLTAAKAGVEVADLDLIVPHQANVRILRMAADQVGLPHDRFLINVDRYGNTSAASIPIALAEAKADGRLKPGHLVMLVAFGAGLSWAGSLIQLPD